MQNIFLRSLTVAIGSVAASLAIAVAIVPALGGKLDGAAWIMCVICPMAVAWPASAYTMLQKRRLLDMHEALKLAHADLAEAHAKLSEKSRRDPMTGMLNRENFFQTVDAGRTRHDSVSLLIVDADRFKSVNDGYGHLTGDEALVEITGAICRAARQKAAVGRIGGEEFGVFLPGASAEDAQFTGERIRREVAAITFRTDRDDRRIPLTVSIGCASGGPDCLLTDLLREADRRLYEAKRRGRNRVVAADVPLAA